MQQERVLTRSSHTACYYDEIKDHAPGLSWFLSKDTNQEMESQHRVRGGSHMVNTHTHRRQMIAQSLIFFKVGILENKLTSRFRTEYLPSDFKRKNRKF